jgi:hypothetical protein
VSKNLLAGTYRLATPKDVASGEWLDPESLQQLVGTAITVTLAKGEEKVLGLEIGKYS